MKTLTKKNIAIVSILGALCAPLAFGCAAPIDAPAAEAPAPESVATAQEALGLGPTDILEEMAKGLIAWTVGKGGDALFPSAGLDVKQLLADIDEQTRAAILEEALRQDKGAVDAAVSKLHDIDEQRKHIGEPGTKTGKELYDEINASTTIALTDEVRAKLGPNADDKYKRAGIKLYVAAVLIDANKLTMMMQLYPATKESNKLTLVQHLREAIAHVRAVTPAGRQAEIDKRLGQIGNCYQYHESRVLGHTDHYVKFVDSSCGGEWGKYDSYDYLTAIGRCDADRDGHIGRVEAALDVTLDGPYGFAMETANAWAKSLAALEGKPESSADMLVGLDFGGMYGWGEPYAGGAKVYANPFTGGASCPAGYDAVKFAGKYNVDYDAYQCVRKSNGLTEPVADFGGMYGIRDYREQIMTQPNPVTGTAGCPTGFTSYRVLGGVSTDRDLNYCARPHVKGTPNDAKKFGGVFSRVNANPNPMSGTTSCPSGFTPTQVWGSNGSSGWRHDQAVVLCTRK